METRLYRRSSADRGSNSRLRRPDPAFAYPLACPVSPDTSNPTMPAQPSPRARTHVTSAPKWTYYRSAAHHPDLPAGAQGCGRHSLICNTPDRVRPLLRIAATEVGHLPRLVAAGSHALPSAHGLCVSVAVRQPIPTLAGACAWRVAWVPCAAYIPPGMHHPGARSTHRPQAVVIPRLSHLGWPRMRGVASVCSHYAQIPNHLRFASVHIRPRNPRCPGIGAENPDPGQNRDSRFPESGIPAKSGFPISRNPGFRPNRDSNPGKSRFFLQRPEP